MPEVAASEGGADAAADEDAASEGFGSEGD